MKDRAILYLSFIISIIALAASIIGLCYVARVQTPGDNYISQQTKSAKAGNRYAEFNLWEAYQNGTHGVDKRQAKADERVDRFVKGIYVVRFEPANDFHPQNAGDYLEDIRKHMPQVSSARNGVGTGSFFRTKKEGGKLVASFPASQPDKLKAISRAIPTSDSFQLRS